MSLEYCHYDGSETIESVISGVNKNALGIIKANENLQKCIMYDDVHAPDELDSFLQKIEDLKIRPDCIYGEGAYEKHAEILVSQLITKDKNYHVFEEGPRTFLLRKDKKYRQENSFLLTYINKERKRFSCPVYVAASYLFKLGFFGKENVKTLYGEDLKIGVNEVVSVLPSRYIQVEANAKTLIELVDVKLASKIRWYFY